VEKSLRSRKKNRIITIKLPQLFESSYLASGDPNVVVSSVAVDLVWLLVCLVGRNFACVGVVCLWFSCSGFRPVFH
jgi:hypothetical protein